MTNWSEDRTIGGRVTVRDMLVDAERRLSAVGISSPPVDAAEIMAFALGTTRNRLFLQDEVTPEQRVHIEQLLTRRISRTPLQHLLGSTGFRHIEVEVGPGVFIPRPETELVTEAAIRELAVQPVGERIAVDLCAGSGAIAISMRLEVEGSRIHAVELSDDAIGWTRRNVDAYQARLSAVGSGVDVIHDDVAVVADHGHSLSRLAGRVAVVIANPPYIPDHMIPREPEVRDHEPAMALYGGDDGLDVVRALLRTAAVLMRPGGLLVIEHAYVQGLAAGARGVPGVVSAMTVDPLLSGRGNLPDGAKVVRSVTDRIDRNGLARFTLARRVLA
jgi:release factor glutamine methyltransferase